MKNAVIYIHGKGGNAGEAAHYQPLFPDSAVYGFDYIAQTPWKAKTFLYLPRAKLQIKSLQPRSRMRSLHPKKPQSRGDPQLFLPLSER